MFVFVIVVFFFSYASTSFNYALLWISYKKIKENAEKVFPVMVLRQGQLQQIHNIDLVPGDIYIPNDEIPCDSLILRGELFAN